MSAEIGLLTLYADGHDWPAGEETRCNRTSPADE